MDDGSADPAEVSTDDEMDDAPDDTPDAAEREHLASRDRMQCSVCKQFYILDPSEPPHDCARLAAAAQDYLLMYECHACKEIFTPLSNVGMHQCRCHPGTYDLDTGWSCCGRRRVEITGRYVHNMVWQRRGQIEPLPPHLTDRRAYRQSNGRYVKYAPDGCTPCDHRHVALPPALSAERAPLSVWKIPEQVRGHMEGLETRPGFRAETQVLVGRGKSPAETRA